MDYTSSLDNVVHQATGQRMHQDTGALPTVWSAKDANSIIWSIMEVIKAAGINMQEFNTDVPASYSELLNSIKKIASTATTPPAGDVSTRVATTEFLKNEFPASLVRNSGYRKIPCKDSPTGYLIHQWGVAASTNGYANVVFPVAFPNMLLRATTNEAAADAWGSWCWVSGISYSKSTKTTLHVQTRSVSNGGYVTGDGAESFTWEVWGY